MENWQDILLKFTEGLKMILGDHLIKVILYGSYARGDHHAGSDIDIMVLTTLSDDQIRDVESKIYDLAFAFQMDHLLDISVIVKNDGHFRYWLGAFPFYDNVQREGISLYG